MGCKRADETPSSTLLTHTVHLVIERGNKLLSALCQLVSKAVQPAADPVAEVGGRELSWAAKVELQSSGGLSNTGRGDAPLALPT